MVRVSFDDQCSYQPINGEFFLMRRDGNIYLVSNWAHDHPFNAIWYIVEMHHA